MLFKNGDVAMKVLINTPNYHRPSLGGVASHYHGLQPYWKERVKYNIVGSRNGKRGEGKYWVLYDVLKFLLKIICFRPQVVLLNPSLAPNAIRRDLIFLRIATLLKRKVVVFFHGFNPDYAETINGEKFYRDFRDADAFMVLSQRAKRYLLGWGIKVPIYLTMTKVDNRMLEGFDIRCRDGVINEILFLSRIEKEKGIFEALECFQMLRCAYPELRFSVVGDGTALDSAKQYVQDAKIENVCFRGKLVGKDLADAYIHADLYLFPSYHEGMPTTVLEAMAFGLPVITRPVGGLVDFFKMGQMGEMIDSLEPSDFISPIEKYLEDGELAKRVSLYNFEYAKNHFLASIVASKIEQILWEVTR